MEAFGTIRATIAKMIKGVAESSIGDRRTPREKGESRKSSKERTSLIEME